MLIFAHRGASKYAPENTMAAFRKAVELGVDGIELDIQMTKDKVPVVIHSDRLAPLTTTYTFVHSTSLRALQTIDAGQGERIPTLEEVLAFFAADHPPSTGSAPLVPQVPRALRAAIHRSPLLLNLELKAQPYWHFGLEERVVALVRRFHLEQQVIFSSFSPLVLWRLRRCAPEVPRGLLNEPRAFFFLRTQFFGRVLAISSFHPFHETTTPQLLGRIRRTGWKIITWTTNTRAEIERAVALGVDGIITDDPVLAKEVCHVGT